MDLAKHIKIVEGFPTEEISFKDISPLLADASAFAETIDLLSNKIKEWGTNVIVGPESRGFVVGAPVAYKSNIGFAMARKKGKLPGEVTSKQYVLEYNTATIELSKDSIKPGDKVAIVDDLLATGGTAQALIELIEEMGGEVVGVATIIELTEFRAKDKFKCPYFSLIQYIH